MSGNDPIARTDTMARILGISTVHLGRLAKADDFPDPVARGRWSVVDVVRAYIRHVEGKADKTEGVKSEELLLIAARREKTEAEAEAQQMKNAVTRGELLARSDVDAAVIEDYSRVRARLLNIPSKVAPLVAAVTEPREAEGLVKRAIHEALQELSDPGALFDAEAGLAGGAEAAADADGERVGRPRAEA